MYFRNLGKVVGSKAHLDPEIFELFQGKVKKTSCWWFWVESCTFYVLLEALKINDNKKESSDTVLFYRYRQLF